MIFVQPQGSRTNRHRIGIMAKAVLLLAFAVNAFAPAIALTTAEIAAFQAKTHVETNTNTQGTVSVTADQNNADVLILTSNGVPDHLTGTFPSRDNPNALEVQDYRWKVNRNPTQAASTTCLPQGPVGMAINGIPIFNAYSITCCDTGVEELDLFDQCWGHPAPNPAGAYHYHIKPLCIFNVTCNVPSTIIGVAFDGFPIYGPNDADGTQLTKADLDECGGKVTNGNYRYHIINEFPYFMGCFKGEVRSDAGIRVSETCTCSEPVEVCTEFAGRRKRQATVTPFDCCVENVNCTFGYKDETLSTSTATTTTDSVGSLRASSLFLHLGLALLVGHMFLY